MIKRWFIGVMAFLLVSGGLPLYAETPGVGPEEEQRARQLFNRAEESFRSGLFAEALAGYRSGYSLHPLPGFLINIAQCHRRMGDLQQARATYQEFIRVAPDSRFAPEVKTVIDELGELLKGSSLTPLPPEENTRSVKPQPFDNVSPRTVEDRGVELKQVTPPDATKGRRWWLWGTVGVVVVGIVATGFALRSPETTIVHDGSVGTLRR